MVKLSVVIVNWNTKDLLIDCLRSIAPAFEAGQIEAIVVDNGSADGSQDAVRAAFPLVTLIDTGANLGYGKACNIGIRKSVAPYVCLLNSDIVVSDGCLEILVAYLDRHPKVAMVGPLIRGPDSRLQDTCRKLPTAWNNFCDASALRKIFPRSEFFSGEHMMFFAHDRETMVDGLAGCFMVVRRDAINDIGLMDEQFFLYCEETDWCKRFRDAGWLIAFCPDAAAIHVHAASSSADPNRFSTVQIVSKILYWNKHNSFIDVACFRGIHLLVCGRKLIGIAIGLVFNRLSPSEARGKAVEILKQGRLLATSGW